MGSTLQEKEFAPTGANSFFEELTPFEKALSESILQVYVFWQRLIYLSLGSN